MTIKVSEVPLQMNFVVVPKREEKTLKILLERLRTTLDEIAEREKISVLQMCYAKDGCD